MSSHTPTTSQPRETVPHPDTINPTDDVLDYVKKYAQAKPEMAALWCFGVGFVLGWRLKPW